MVNATSLWKGGGGDNQSNRYYMPKYLNWLKKKLPFITLWGNFCLGDLKRYNESYDYSLPKCLGKTIIDANRMNATVEHFFTLKKSNPLELRLPLPEFIEKCWKDNKGLRKQFINGLEVGIKERTSPIVRKRTVDRKSKMLLT